MSGLIWIQTVWEGYQQASKVANSRVHVRDNEHQLLESVQAFD